MKVMVIPILSGALGMGFKGFEKKIGGMENQKKNQNNPDYRLARLLSRIEKNCHSDSSERTPALADMKILHGV